MSHEQTSTPADLAGTPPRARGADLDSWRAWVAFGGILMAVLGIFSVIMGITALISPDVFVTVEGTVLAIDISAWGWVHIVVGAVLTVTGFALLNGAPEWARGLGIGITGFGMLVQMAWIPAHPLWSIFMVVLDVIVLYALVVTWDGRSTGRRTA